MSIRKAYRQLYRRSLLSNLQNPNWIADVLSFVCHFISSPKSTPNNARWEREMGRGWCWFLRCTSALRWVRSGRKVKGLRGGVGLLWLWFNFLSKKHIHEPRLDCGNGSQRCFHISLQFVVDRLILFQQNCPVLCINILSEHNSRDCSRVRIKEH